MCARVRECVSQRARDRGRLQWRPRRRPRVESACASINSRRESTDDKKKRGTCRPSCIRSSTLIRSSAAPTDSHKPHTPHHNPPLTQTLSLAVSISLSLSFCLSPPLTRSLFPGVPDSRCRVWEAKGRQLAAIAVHPRPGKNVAVGGGGPAGLPACARVR